MSAPTRTLADFGAAPISDGGHRTETDDVDHHVSRGPAQSSLVDPEQAGVSLSTTHLPDDRPQLLENSERSAFLVREKVSGQERVNTVVCPICGRHRDTWAEDKGRASEHFARADHDWSALMRAREVLAEHY